MKINRFKSMVLLVLILLVLSAVGKSAAMPYSQVNILSNVTQTSNFYSYSTVNYTLTIYNSSNSNFNLSLPLSAKNLTSLNNFKIYPSSDCHTFSIINGCILVEIENVKDGVPITLQYDYYQNYNTANNSFNSTIYFLPSSFTRSLTIKMLLPNGAYIPTGAYDVPTSTITPIGNHFEVSWNLINQSYPDVTGYYIDLPFTIQYNLVIANKKPSNQNYYLYIIPIIAFFAVIIGWYFYSNKSKRSSFKTPKKKSNKKFALNLLNRDEKLVLSAVDKKGFTYQADIIKRTGFSKIKVSKILSKLTNYKLLKIKQEGRVNKVKRL